MAERTVLTRGMLPDLEDLRVFRAVASEGGVNSAARSLALPQSTISRRLSRLEELLAVRLFKRTRRGLALTYSGASLLERAQIILGEVDAMLAEATGAASRPRGRLRVSAPADLVGERDTWLRVVTELPEVVLELEFSNRYVDVVREGFDLALRAGRGGDDSLVVKRLGAYDLYAVASVDYLSAHGALREPAELREHSCLLLSPFSTKPGRKGAALPRRHLVLGDSHLVRDGALRGLGIAILPWSLVGDDIERGALVPVLPAYNPLSVPLFAAYPDKKGIAAAQRAFVDLFTRIFGRHPARPGAGPLGDRGAP